MLHSFTRYSTNDKKELSQKLAKFDDVLALGPLLQAAQHLAHPEATDALYSTLAALLPTLKASDRNVLNDEDFLLLLSSLSGCHASMTSRPARLVYETYYIAVLKAMQQIGDERALVRVKRIVDLTPRSEASKRIHSAAIECLSALRTRGSTEGLGLLRPVTEQHDSNLLRPVAPSVDGSEYHRLLRSEYTEAESKATLKPAATEQLECDVQVKRSASNVGQTHRQALLRRSQK